MDWMKNKTAYDEMNDVPLFPSSPSCSSRQSSVVSILAGDAAIGVMRSAHGLGCADTRDTGAVAKLAFVPSGTCDRSPAISSLGNGRQQESVPSGTVESLVCHCPCKPSAVPDGTDILGALAATSELVG